MFLDYNLKLIPPTLSQLRGLVFLRHYYRTRIIFIDFTNLPLSGS